MLEEANLRIWDISQALRTGLPVWPGDTPFEEKRIVDMALGANFNLTRISMSSHSGSHADGQLHYRANGAAIGDAKLQCYIGPAQLITVRSRGLVSCESVLPNLVHGMRRVLLHTFEAFPHDRWCSDFPGIEPRLINELATRGGILIGTDAPSIDPQASVRMPAHSAAALHGLAILEGLVFDGIPDGIYELIAPPLRLANADASPVRALLREMPG